jgi:carbon storage regulator
MLVLSRKLNERIVINGNIVVTVVDIRGDKVRLGVEAPRDVAVYRSELLESIQADVICRGLAPDAQGVSS